MVAIASTSFTENIKLDPLPGKYLWTADSIDAYSENVSSPDVRKRFQDFENQEFNDPDTAATVFNKIVLAVARSSSKHVKISQTRKGRRKTTINHGLASHAKTKDSRNTLKKYETLVRKNPADGSYRHAFYSCRSKFRRLCHYEEKQFNHSLLHAITNNMDSDPKIFWNLINKLSKSSTKPSEENIQHDKFINFLRL